MPRFEKGHLSWLKGTKGIAHKGKKLFKVHRKKLSEAKKGNKSYQWKGGLTWLQKKEQLAKRKRPEQCELCEAVGGICFDHNHMTGKFRGWICKRCNFALGFVKDNVELLVRMIDYISKSKE